MKEERLLHRQFVIEPEEIGQEPDMGMHAARVLAHLGPRDVDGSG